MFKRLFLIIVVLAFGTGILLISLDRVNCSVKPSFAASSLKFTIPSLPPSQTITPSPQPKSEYYLVYPGVLPDHPLYKIKMIRDQIWLNLTSDSLKKAELLLLFADKRIGAGEVLVRGNKISLGVDTLTKGIKYFERAVSEADKAKGKSNTDELKKELKGASLKYEEVISALSEKIDSSEVKSYLNNLLGTIKDLREKSLSF